jgi:CBS domain-containing protein
MDPGEEDDMLARHIMTTNPICVTKRDTAQTAARLMVEEHCGSLPVVDDSRHRHLLGIVTDRDLAVRVLAPGKPVDTPVGEVMSAGVSCCMPDTRVEVVEDIMARRRVRRVPVVDDRGNCVGIIALADLARASLASREVDDREVARVLEHISEPTEEARTDEDIGVHPERLAAAQPSPLF